MNGGGILKNMWAIEYRGESFFFLFFFLLFSEIECYYFSEREREAWDQKKEKEGLLFLVRGKGRHGTKKRKRGGICF